MPRIAIVDDDTVIRSLLAEWLTAEGYRVSEAGVDRAPDESADLVLVDVYLPRKFGVERLRSAQRAYPRTPIIAMSAQFQSRVECAGPAARALGVGGVIAKPFGREELLHAVRSVIGLPVDRIA